VIRAIRVYCREKSALSKKRTVHAAMPGGLRTGVQKVVAAIPLSGVLDDRIERPR
jgi:hypothetical protein